MKKLVDASLCLFCTLSDTHLSFDTPCLGDSARDTIAPYPAQQDNCFTSLLKVWAQSLMPSTMVR